MAKPFNLYHDMTPVDPLVLAAEQRAFKSQSRTDQPQDAPHSRFAHKNVDVIRDPPVAPADLSLNQHDSYAYVRERNRGSIGISMNFDGTPRASSTVPPFPQHVDPIGPPRRRVAVTAPPASTVIHQMGVNALFSGTSTHPQPQYMTRAMGERTGGQRILQGYTMRESELANKRRIQSDLLAYDLHHRGQVQLQRMEAKEAQYHERLESSIPAPIFRSDTRISPSYTGRIPFSITNPYRIVPTESEVANQQTRRDEILQQAEQDRMKEAYNKQVEAVEANAVRDSYPFDRRHQALQHNQPPPSTLGKARIQHVFSNGNAKSIDPIQAESYQRDLNSQIALKRQAPSEETVQETPLLSVPDSCKTKQARIIHTLRPQGVVVPGMDPEDGLDKTRQDSYRMALEKAQAVPRDLPAPQRTTLKALDDKRMTHKRTDVWPDAAPPRSEDGGVAYMHFGTAGGGAPIQGSHGNIVTRVSPFQKSVDRSDPIGTPFHQHNQQVLTLAAIKQQKARLMRQHDDTLKPQGTALIEPSVLDAWHLGHAANTRNGHTVHAHSDVVRERLMIPTSDVNKAKAYHKELDAQVKQNNERRISERR